MQKRFCLSGILATMVVLGVAEAEVRPAALFSDHMVLQSGTSVPVWGKADPGEKITVTFLKQKKSVTADADGHWMLRLSKLNTGGPYSMTITGTNTVKINDILVGEVWMGTGQSNMVFTLSKKAESFAGVENEEQEIAAAKYPEIRMFTAETVKSYTPQSEVQGRWLICSPENAGKFSAVGYYFARSLQKQLKVPVGMVTVAYGGSTAEAWLPREVIAADPVLKPMLDDFDALESFYKSHPDATTEQAPKIPQTINARPGKPGPLKDPVQDQHQPTVLFNGMLKPVIPYAMHGVLWYQGESIVGGRHGVEVYPHTMETLVKEWRKLWAQGDFPFYTVQLAALKNVSNNPATREAQAHVLTLPNTEMAVTIDIGDQKNVHPKNKAPLGDRLARIALAKAYGRDIEYSGPRYESFKVEGDAIRVKFSHAKGGLVAKGGSLRWFQIAGADKNFVDATAIIDGDTVIVRSEKVAQPVAVRYAWANYPEGCNLYNWEDLPASPFRTDNWDVLTAISQEFTGK